MSREITAPTRPAATSSVVPHLSLDEAVLRVHRKWERVVDTQQKAHSARVECGIELLALKSRIEAGEAGPISFWDWYQIKFTRDRRDAERVMAIASAENPEAAHEAEKAATRERMRALRARTGAQAQCAPGERNFSRVRTREPEPRQEVLPPEPSQEEIQDQIVDLFKRLHRTAQVRCALRLRKIIGGEA
jgi:hypothetical protein